MKKSLFVILVAISLVLNFGCQNPSDSGSVLTYSVIYDANGGTGTAPCDATQYQAGKQVTVCANTLSKNAYTFTEWNTKADGSGTVYAPSATFTMPANDVTLYAQWVVSETYNIIYDANGGTSAPVDETGYLANSNAVVLAAVPTKADNFFLGWTLASDNSGTVLKAGDSIVIASSNVTLYAKWSPKKVSMKFYDGCINDEDSYADAKYLFSFVGYGSLTAGNFVVTDADGTVYTGTYETSTGEYPSTASTNNVNVERTYYKFTLANGEWINAEFKKTYRKSSGLLLRRTSSNLGRTESSESATAVAIALFGVQPTGTTISAKEYTEF